MADTASPTPGTDAGTPVKITVGASLPAWARILIAFAVAGVIGLGGVEVHRHLKPVPVPPAPAPTPKPTPEPTPAPVVDATPQAVVSGMFLAVQPSPPQAAPGDPPAPLGMFRIDASASKSQHPIRWKAKGPTAVKPTILSPAGGPPESIAEAIVTEPGTYRFHGIATGTTGGKPDADVDTFQYTVGAPDPKPDPNPPGPKPDPAKPAPIAGDGLRVLVVYESADLSKYPPSQVNAIHGGPLHDFLVANCTKVNGVPEARFLDKDTDMSNESKTWQDAMKSAAPASLPWIVISNGKTGTREPMPKDADSTIALIQKYLPSK